MAGEDDSMKPSATFMNLSVGDFSELDRSNTCSVLLDNFMEHFSNFRFHFLHTAQLFCSSHFSVSTTGKKKNLCFMKGATFNHNQCGARSASANALKEEKSSLNTTLVSTTNTATENNVQGWRGNWAVLNGSHGDKRGTLARPVYCLRGSERKE